ncbi:hypothetical protein AKJ52_02780 [candidate division MSBL1 archaeon SCGC-AAA382C18]|uniref:YprB ribonuclease H-like domain-containing protein n=1 Tax=candidate division MSBL1 archaeon SCGC-AAA382C18 TaxID=1698281 RepID=A0A133VHN5_9EURY|nr:hypothetical protein AKJ52_02780 [candidate division MSBL1 archaeon SCGC-AAA382C18]
MLKNTFLHVPRIGAKRERKLWKHEILTWGLAEKNIGNLDFLGPETESTLDDYLDFSKEAYKEENTSFFVSLLDRPDWWRLYPEFEDKVVFLDIETTGLSPYYHKITLVGIYNPNWKTPKIFVRGGNLEELPNELEKFNIFVTFNGSNFDIPFLKKEFESKISFPIHLDLRFILRKLDLNGGLKNIEDKLNIPRIEEIEDIDSSLAPTLWDKFQNNDLESIKSLVKYNQADVINLKFLMDIAYENLKERTMNGTRKENMKNFLLKSEKFSTKDVKNKMANSIEAQKTGKKTVVLQFNGRNIKIDREKIITLTDILDNFDGGKFPSVLGIDLSASEEKESGLSFLKGKKSETWLKEKDSDFIKLTKDYNVNLVSIDSPLSLPEGRCCTSENCECSDNGIIRECERTLKSRGSGELVSTV